MVIIPIFAPVMGLDTDKRWIRELANICSVKGVNKVVMSPGSRCAPLVIAFNRHPGIECISIIDERSAAFFALGMAQQLQTPVALLCTSGTAVLNYAPAIAEAYYQKIPLIVITADRPPELIDQADGQAIRQQDIYRNYIKQSFQLPVEAMEGNPLKHSNRIIAEAINISMFGGRGPVHINVPLREPLYGLKEYDDDRNADNIEVGLTGLSAVPGNGELEYFRREWQQSVRKMILAGSNPPSVLLQKAITDLSPDPSIAIIAEVTSNLSGTDLFHTPDALLASTNESEEHLYQPNILVTFGGGIVSKKLKNFLRRNTFLQHWHIDPSGAHIDTYGHLTHVIPTTPEAFLQYLATNTEQGGGDLKGNWLTLRDKYRKRHKVMLNETGYNDLKVFELLLNSLPANSNLHLGNSTPIRYTGLFEPHSGLHIIYNSNRGTSGIDGVVSTAAGASKATGILTTIITGDVAFFYDSNALWNKNLPGNLRIIIINNNGGNIFRVLQGDHPLPELEEYFETKMDLRAEHIALTFNLPYYFCSDLEQLKETLPKFFQPHNNKCAILEIKTPAEASAKAMRNYLGI